MNSVPPKTNYPSIVNTSHTASSFDLTNKYAFTLLPESARYFFKTSKNFYSNWFPHGKVHARKPFKNILQKFPQRKKKLQESRKGLSKPKGKVLTTSADF
jgi:hypothetical protein